MALYWFRRHSKRLMIPLAFIIIVTFVFLYGPARRSGRGGSDAGWVTIGGETISARKLAEYRRALLVIARAFRGVDSGDLGHIRYLTKAKLAENAGVTVSAEQLREVIRAIMSSPANLGTKDFTNSSYLDALERFRVSPPVFEDFVGRFLAAETLRVTIARSAYLTGEEQRIAFRRDKDRLKLRVKDFDVAAFEKEATAPTDEEIAKYYAEHKALPLDDDLALATEPDVSIEYCFVEKSGAAKLAAALRRSDEGLRFEGLLGGAGGGLAGRLATATFEADREDKLRSRYERDKRRLYKIEPEKPKPATGEDADKRDEGARGPEGGSGVIGVAAAIAPTILTAAAPGTEAGGGATPPAPPKPEPGAGATPAEPGAAAAAAEEPPAEPEPPKEEFKPFDEVRDRVARDLDKNAVRSLENPAARQSAERVVEIVSRRERDRPVGADALLEGLSLGAVPALAGASGIVDRVDIERACLEAGAVHGVTRLAKADALKRIPRLGAMRRIPERATQRAADGTGDEWSAPDAVGRGTIVWRVADYVPPRLLTSDEAKETVKKRIVHERAADLAAKAAEQFRRDLQEGEVTVADMTLTRPLSVKAAKAEPFAMLGLGEVAAEAVAVEEKGDARVRVDLELAIGDYADALANAGVADEAGDAAERLAREARAQKTARYRVAVPAERVEPGHGEWVRWRGDRAANMDQYMRAAFMAEVWNDLAFEEVKYDESEEFAAFRAGLRRKREEEQRREAEKGR